MDAKKRTQVLNTLLEVKSQNIVMSGWAVASRFDIMIELISMAEKKY